MIRTLAGLLLPVLLLTSCGLIDAGKRPKFTGPVEKPSWQVDGIMVDQVFIGNRIVFCRARTFASFEERLYAFSVEDGSHLWVSGFEPAPGQNHFVFRDLLVIEDSEHRPRVLDSRTGKAAGQTHFDNVLRGGSMDGIAYVVADGRLAAYAAEAKGELWHADLPVAVADGPVITGNTVYVSGPTDKTRTLYAFDRVTGAAKWKWSFNGYGSPIAADDNAVFANAAADSASLVAINAAKGTPKWTKPVLNPSTVDAPVLLGSSSLLIRDDPPGKDGRRAQSGYVLRTLNRETGATEREVTTAWKYPDWIMPREGLILASDKESGPLLNEGGDSAPDSWVSGIGLSDGREIWRTEPVHYGIFTPLCAGSGIVAVGIQPYGPPVPKLGDPTPAGLWAFKITLE